MATEIPHAEWLGRTWEREDVIGARLVAEFRVTLDPHLVDDGGVPHGIHWCLCPDIVTPDLLGRDAHPRPGLFLPEVGLPRRMWAGGEVEIEGSFEIGDRVVRTSTITGVSRKSGKSGDLCFVTVQHSFAVGRSIRITERQDIVYREEPRPGSSPAGRLGPILPPPADSWTVDSTPTLLFRYSAMSFNGHRIHYDYPYATGVEGYSGLVVHAPIQATLMLHRVAAERRHFPSRFSYRGQAPLICGMPFHVCSSEGHTQVVAADGTVTMTGEAN